MRAAISLSDDLVAEADRMASRAGISRSELYARALRAYLDRHDGVREALDALYAGEDSRIDPLLVHAQADALDL